MSAVPSFSPPSQPDKASEQLLIERCSHGDLSAFDELVAIHQDRIYNLCYWMLGHREDARDASQDAFVRAYRSLKKFRGDSSFGTWLHRIAVNVCFDALGRRRRAPLAYADLGDDSSALDEDSFTNPAERTDARHERSTRVPGSHILETGTDDPSRAALAREREHAVRCALAQLPEHYRLALVLFDIEGYSYDEIAQSLKLPLGTVKSRINRARLALREQLENQQELFQV